MSVPRHPDFFALRWRRAYLDVSTGWRWRWLWSPPSPDEGGYRICVLGLLVEFGRRPS